MLAITTTAVAGDQSGADLDFSVNATVEANTLEIVLDDTSNAGFVTATITRDAPSTGPVTVQYWNFGTIKFAGSTDAAGTIDNFVNLTTPYQADVLGFGAGASLSVTNWLVNASFTASPFFAGGTVPLDLLNADKLDVKAATFSADDVSTIAGEFQSPTDLVANPTIPGAVISLTDSTSGIEDNANVAIRTYQLKLDATNAGIAINAGISAIKNTQITTDAGVLSLGDGTGVTPRTLSSDTGDIEVRSTAGPISLQGVAVSALVGGIAVTTSSMLTISSSVTAVTSFAAPATYAPSDTTTPVPNGLVRLQGSLGLPQPPLPVALPVTAGRLEISTNAVAPISLSNLSVGSLKAETGGSLSVVNAVPLVISDSDATTPTIEITATDLSIQSPAGIRVVDGIKVTGKLVLSTYVSGTTVTPTVPVDFVVTGTGDNPLASAAFAGTLRDMIEYVNVNGLLPTGNPLFTLTKQPMQILFDESGSPVATGGVVTLATTLPAILKPVTVDGSLPGPNAATPPDLGGIVGINGSSVAATGFVFGEGSSGSTVRDVALYGFAGAALRVETADNLVSGVTLGADRTGARGPGVVGNAVGIEVVGASALRNVIGVKTPGVDTGNTIVGNTQAGVLIRGGANATGIYGNTIGSAAAGFGNGDGIHVVTSTGTLIGATRVGLGNDISGNASNGVRLTTVNAVSSSYGARIVGNTIADNGSAGVLVEGGSRNVVGGTGFREGNAIARNSVGVQMQSNGTARSQGNQVLNNLITDGTVGGVLIDQGFGNLVQGNVVTDATGGTQSLWGVRIFRSPQGQGFSPNRVYQNTVSGAGDPANVPLVGGGGIVVENSSGQIIGGPGTLANTVVDNPGSGIVVVGGTGVNAASSNVIEGNLVGTDAGGSARGNSLDGIRLQGSLGNVVRGNTVRFQGAAANNSAGIAVVDAIGLTAAAGNQIVLNSVGDNYVGIRVSGGSNTAIGGRVAGLGNWVFRSASDGILVERSAATGDASATVIKGNRVGLATVPNSTVPQPAGNAGFGINLKSTVGTTVDQGNLVAYNTSGGIQMQGGRNAVIGSVMAGLGNVIRDNLADGISLVQPTSPGRTENVLIAGNTIRGNSRNGVTVADTTAASAATARVSGITIGRAVATNRPDASTNTIVANDGVGVQVDRAQAVAVIGNAITGNLGTKQIELLNDANAVTGTSLLAPRLTAASPRVVGQSSPQYDVRGVVSRTSIGTGPQTVFVDIYGTKTSTNEQYFLGRVAVTIRAGASDSSFRVIVGRPGVRFNQIVATSSLGAGTSEFSNAINL